MTATRLFRIALTFCAFCAVGTVLGLALAGGGRS